MRSAWKYVFLGALFGSAFAAGCRTGEPPAKQAALREGPHFVAAPAEGELVGWIAAQASAAGERGGRAVVYVSARWCEPLLQLYSRLPKPSGGKLSGPPANPVGRNPATVREPDSGNEISVG